MPDRYIQSHISQIPLFSALNPEQLAWVATGFELRRYEPEEYVFRQGDPTTGLYMFASGSGVLLRTTGDGQERPVAVVQAGQYLNEKALLRDGQETASLYIQQPSTLLFLSRQSILTVVAHHPELRTSLGLQGSMAHHQHEVHFRGQRENEAVLLETRRHWWAYVRMAWLPILLLIGGFVLAVLVQQPALSLALVVLTLLVPGLLMLYFFLEWRNDALIITTQRVVRIHRVILTFSENVSEIPLASILEVNYELPVTDPFARIFGYGRLEVRTAGDGANFVLDLIPDVEKIQKMILEDRDLYTQRMSERERYAMRAEMERWLGREEGVTAGPGQQGQPGAASHIPRRGLLPTKFHNEQGEIVYRKHQIVWFQHVLGPLSIMLIGLVLFLLTLFVPLFQAFGAIGLAFAALLFVGGGIFFYWMDWDWRNDYYVVGDTIIKLIHRRPLWLQNENDQILIERIDNVAAETSGFWARILNYGDVRISLIGAEHPKVFSSVPDPLGIQAKISSRQERMKQRKDEELSRRQREALGEYLTLYHETVHGSDGPPMPQLPGAAPAAGQHPGYAGPTQPMQPLDPTQPMYPGHAGPTQPVRPAHPGHAGPTQPMQPYGPPAEGDDQVQRPHLSPGIPYSPTPRTGSRPPGIPRARRPDENP